MVRKEERESEKWDMREGRWGWERKEKRGDEEEVKKVGMG